MTSSVVIELLGGLATFALVASLIQALPRRAMVRTRRVVPIVVAFALLAAALVAAAAVDVPVTGARAVDSCLVGSVVFATGLAGAVANRWALAVLALAPALAPGSQVSHGVGAMAVGVAFAVTAVGMRLPPVKAVAGSLIGFALLVEVGRGPAGALSCASGLLLLLLAAATRVSPRGRREILLGSLGVALFAALAGGSYALMALQARRHLDQAVVDARLALDAATGPTPSEALAGFQRAGIEFSSASSRLDSLWGRPVAVVPGAAQNARALSTAARVGQALAQAGADAVAARTSAHLHVTGSAVNVAALESLRDPAARAEASLRAGHARLDHVRSPLLLPVVDRNLRTLLDRIDRADHQATTLEDALAVLPGLMGSTTPRRYFLAIQNPAEARATGGIIGNFALVTVTNGHIDLTTQGRDDQLNTAGNPPARTLDGPADYLARYGRFEPAQTWQNVTLSPDFPSVGRVIEQLYPQSGGVPVDGVISVDPAALAGVLQLIGPVSVPLWPVPLSGSNVTPILLHDQYLLPQTARLEFMTDLVQSVFDRLKVVDLTDPKAISAVFAGLFREKHVLLYSAAAPEEHEFAQLGAAGALSAAPDDFLATTTQNSSGNKIDWYLRRSVRDDIHLDPATGSVRATVTITLENTAPSEGVPDYVIGGVGPQATRRGENRTWVSIYTPLRLDGATFDAQPIGVDHQVELRRNVFSAFIVLEPGSTSTFVVNLSGRVLPGPRYELNVFAQPAVTPEQLAVHVSLPAGWRVRSAPGGRPTGSEVNWTNLNISDETLGVVSSRG